MHDSVLAQDGGHAAPFGALLLGVVGALALAFGVTGERDAIVIVGGVLLALALVGASVATHGTVDYDIYRRLEALEQERSQQS